jgi:O-antigen/teichoic acid export membrane protein
MSGSEMTDRKQKILNASLISAGGLVTLLFMSTDGNGQNPLPLLVPVGIGLLINGIVGCLLGRFIKSRWLASISAMIITEQVYVLAAMYLTLARASNDPHYGEELSMIPVVLVVFTTPMVILSSIGFVRLASRWASPKETEPEDPLGVVVGLLAQLGQNVCKHARHRPGLMKEE